jgi:hypothetical protein
MSLSQKASKFMRAVNGLRLLLVSAALVFLLTSPSLPGGAQTESPAVRPNVTLDIENASPRVAFERLFRAAGVNYIISAPNLDAIESAKVSAHLNETPLVEAVSSPAWHGKPCHDGICLLLTSVSVISVTLI